jgi:hypothetical protein
MDGTEKSLLVFPFQFHQEHRVTFDFEFRIVAETTHWHVGFGTWYCWSDEHSSLFFSVFRACFLANLAIK